MKRPDSRLPVVAIEDPFQFKIRESDSYTYVEIAGSVYMIYKKKEVARANPIKT